MTKESPASLTPEERARSTEEILADIEAINRKTQESADLLLEYIGAIRRGEEPPFRVVDDSAAEARGRERGIEEAAGVLDAEAATQSGYGDLGDYAEDLARQLRALLSAEPQATPPSQREDRQTDRQEMATSPLEKIGKP